MSRRCCLPILALLSAGLLAGCSVVTSRLLAKGADKAASSGGSETGGKVLEKVADEGITNEMHAKYVGQIVFASREIERDSPDESTFAAEFYGDETIYGRAYLPHSLQNEPVYSEVSNEPSRNIRSGFEYRLVVDGKPHAAILEHGEVRHDRRRHTTQQVWPRPAPSDDKTSATWVELVRELAPGKHEIRVELWPREGQFQGRAPLAKGTFTLHKTADTRIGYGRTVRDLQAGMTDEALVRQLTAVIQAHAKKEGWKETIPSVTIENREWGVVLARLTKAQVARRVAAAVHLVHGDVCDAQRVVFEQKVRPSKGPVGDLYVVEVGARTPLDCAPIEIGPDRWAGRTRARPRPIQGGAERSEVATAAPEAPAPTEPKTQSPTPTQARPSKGKTTAMATAEPANERLVVVGETEPRAARPGRFSIGLGMAANALDATGVATYGNLGIHLGRVELGVGATWPLNALGYLRVNVLSGRFELSPMITATALAEMDVDTTFALAGGVSFAYALTTGGVRAGLRLDALVSYNPEPGELAVPLLGSTYVRF